MEPSKKLESRQINEEGELIGAVFCEFCGGLNPADAAECEHCNEHIVDQGPDLRSRLQRIRRYASGAPSTSRPQADNWMVGLLAGVVYSIVPVPTTLNKGKPSRITLWLKENLHEVKLLILGSWVWKHLPHIAVGYVILQIVFIGLMMLLGR